MIFRHLKMSLILVELQNVGFKVDQKLSVWFWNTVSTCILKTLVFDQDKGLRSQIRKHSLFLLQVYQPRPPPQARYEGHDGLADLQTSFLGRPSRGHQEQSASRDNQTPLNSKTKTPGTNLRYVHIKARFLSARRALLCFLFFS